MALTIKERSGTFFVQGTIDSTTASSFKNHFKFLMNDYKDLIINVDDVTKIDTSGMLVLYKLHMDSLIYGVNFKITGKASIKIYESFDCTKVA
jgi:anti-anti-sigma regulatory factor